MPTHNALSAKQAALLVALVRSDLTVPACAAVLGTSTQGAAMTAASLVRRGLAEREQTIGRPPAHVTYTVTPIGRMTAGRVPAAVPAAVPDDREARWAADRAETVRQQDLRFARLAAAHTVPATVAPPAAPPARRTVAGVLSVALTAVAVALTAGTVALLAPMASTALLAPTAIHTGTVSAAPCRAIALSADTGIGIDEATHPLVGAVRAGTRWTVNGRTVGYSVTDDSTVWSSARCTAPCRVVARSVDYATAADARTLTGADYHGAGTWSRGGRTIGYSSAEDSTVWNVQGCATLPDPASGRTH